MIHPAAQCAHHRIHALIPARMMHRVGVWMIVLVLAASAAVQAEFWHVSPTGDDTAVGSLEHPFATIQRAQTDANPGDTVWIRGGTYVMTDAQIARLAAIFAHLIVLDKSGEPGKPITYAAYQNEKPVFDCSRVFPEGKRLDAFFVTGSWLHLKGLHVTGVQVTMTGKTQSICFSSNGSHNVFEQLSMSDGQAIGLYHLRGSNNLFLNCDAWNNWDYTSEDGKGGNVDGFGCHPPKGSTGNVFRGCRAWFNSDDGYDLLGAAESVTIENCWAFYNGYTPKFESVADGNGFKAGGYGGAEAGRLPNPIPRHIIRFCLAVRNKNSGFYANHHPGGCDWLHNSAYRNGSNFNMLGRLLDNVTDVDGYGHRLVNNVSFKSRGDLVRIDRAKCELIHNSFSMEPPLSAKDFESLDEELLLQPRMADGQLPQTPFMRPTPGSALIDSGAEIHLPFRGPKPDLGAFER